MDEFGGRIAVVTGGGTGMGAELVRQLAAEGCHVATCDVSAEAMAETKAAALGGAPTGTRVATFEADVSDESRLIAFRDLVSTELATDHINLLFNNAGIGGGGSMITDARDEWERTFDVDWGGVYNGTRTFLPMLLAADEGHVINTSSINGLLASVGPTVPHTAYSTAKFAVRGFTEALIADFRVNAPHLHASVVMPGHIGTSIVINSGKAHGREPDSMGTDDLAKLRSQLAAGGIELGAMSDDDLRKGIQMMGETFRDGADHRGPGGHHHPRRRPAESVADSGRRGRRGARPGRAGRSRACLRPRVLGRPPRQGPLRALRRQRRVTMPKFSAGLLPYRFAGDDGLELFVVHPGGPFWANKDLHAWSIAKGEHDETDDPAAAAEREVAEELGVPAPPGFRTDLGQITQAGGKRVRVWAVEAPAFEVAEVVSNEFEMEWPPKSGRRQSFPEVDRAEWMPVVTARLKLVKGQVSFIDRLIGLQIDAGTIVNGKVVDKE